MMCYAWVFRVTEDQGFTTDSSNISTQLHLQAHSGDVGIEHMYNSLAKSDKRFRLTMSGTAANEYL